MTFVDFNIFVNFISEETVERNEINVYDIHTYILSSVHHDNDDLKFITYKEFNKKVLKVPILTV